MVENKKISFFLRNKRELDIEQEKKDSDRERIIVIYKEKKELFIKIQNFKELFTILENLNFPYFYFQSEKIYFNYVKNIQCF